MNKLKPSRRLFGTAQLLLVLSKIAAPAKHKIARCRLLNEVFHFPCVICSQKVQMTLIERRHARVVLNQGKAVIVYVLKLILDGPCIVHRHLFWLVDTGADLQARSIIPPADLAELRD